MNLEKPYLYIFRCSVITRTNQLNLTANKTYRETDILNKLISNKNTRRYEQELHTFAFVKK